jgi:hypothetical protein
MVDPLLVGYHQQDFRDPRIIGRENGPKPVPRCLMLHRIGREREEFVSSAEVHQCVNAFYKMYGWGFRARDIQVVFETLKTYPSANTHIPLVLPISELKNPK